MNFVFVRKSENGNAWFGRGGVWKCKPFDETSDALYTRSVISTGGKCRNHNSKLRASYELNNYRVLQWNLGLMHQDYKWILHVCFALKAGLLQISSCFIWPVKKLCTLWLFTLILTMIIFPMINNIPFVKQEGLVHDRFGPPRELVSWLQLAVG